jgi:D-lactate dehydrogenase
MRPPAPAVLDGLHRILPRERVLARPIDRLARAGDASLYRLIPEAVVRPKDVDEVRSLLAFARCRGRHLAFRAAGTSLCGQAQTDGLLVELAPHWRGFKILDDGARVVAQPGVVGGHLNRVLAAHGRRIGPDPASIDAAMIGGIVANNASGMCCGVAQNSYCTLESMTLLLADGTLVDTSRADADEELRRMRPDLHRGLAALRDEVRADAALAARIRRKFAGKNTTGYSLNALLDCDRPSDILARLMVGSEGTLGFLADVTLRTVPDPPQRATGLIVFADIAQAGAAVAPLAEAGAAALEIMDSRSLRIQAERAAFPFAVEERMAALLTEFQVDSAGALREATGRAEKVLSRYDLAIPPRFTRDPAERERLWKLRKGLAVLTGASRPSGTAFIPEDVAVPVARLAEAVVDCQALFAEHGLPGMFLFGHAKDGNLHFVLAEDVSSPQGVARYDRFVGGLVNLVVRKYDGALKAEHGSGRNMAPFVRTEWGDAAYAVMWRIKELLDPENVLAPGVVLNDDPEVHLKHLKPLTSITDTADHCIECGFCEPRCPSRHATLSPRQRIAVVRELALLEGRTAPEARALRDALAADFVHDGVATCIGDSMCETSCPVSIDTGRLVRDLKATLHGPASRRLARALARRFGDTAALARAGLRAVQGLGAVPGGRRLLDAATGLGHRLAPGLVPRLRPASQVPPPAPPLPRLHEATGRRVVYFPSCLSRVLGPEPGALPTAQAVVEALAAAGVAASYPERVASLCCGMPFASKAFPDAARVAAERTAEALWRASHEGRDVVVTDASPCAGFLQEQAVALLERDGRRLRVLDFPAFWAREVLPALAAPPRLATRAVLHPTCTLARSGGLADLVAVARAHCAEATLPASAECCGFGGDRGFLVPEVTAAATSQEAEEIRRLLEPAGAALYSTCRTCEIGLTRAVGRSCLSLPHLVHAAMLGAPLSS